MKSYVKFFILFIGLIFFYLIIDNIILDASNNEDKKRKNYDDVIVEGDIKNDSFLANRTSSQRTHRSNSKALEDWQIFIRTTIQNYEGDDCIKRLYDYSDHHAKDKNFNRVGFINELLKFKGDIYELNFIMCNIYSRSIDISDTQFLEEISSFNLIDLHKEFFYSAVVTSSVIQDADTANIKRFVEKSSDAILNRYLCSIIENR